MQEPVGVFIILVFIGTYIAISSEKVNRAAMSMVGMGLAGLVLWAAYTVDQTTGAKFTTLVEHIEWSTILFIVAMMAIVSVAGHSGMFQYIALTLAKPSGVDTRRLFITFIVFVFIISLIFDTTSTILIMGPLTIEVCRALEIDFKPFLISEAIVANFASIPSVVGAVPNLVIVDQTLLLSETSGFNASLLFVVLMPLSCILLLVTLPLLLRLFKDRLADSEDDIVDEVFVVAPQTMIRSKSDFYLSLAAISMLAIAFVWGQGSGLEPPLVAIIVAFMLLMMTRERVENILSRIDWNTVFFLIGIFGLVGALEVVGFIDDIGAAVTTFIEGSLGLAVGFLVWIPALLSAIIDNIPVSIILAPIAAELALVSPVFPAILVFAVNVGGYILPIGAPANLVAMSLAEEGNDRISFASFAKIATPLAFIHLLIGTGWLFLISLVL